MFKKSLVAILFFLFTTVCFGGINDSMFVKLDRAIETKGIYTLQKDKKIAKIKRALKGAVSLQEQYLLNEKLYTEYRKFKIDSALYFTKENIRLAELLHKEDLKTIPTLHLANLYSSSGRFLESQELYQSIKNKSLSDSQKILYYEYYIEFYEHYNSNYPNKKYTEQIEKYRDSLFGVLNPQSSKFKINLALRLLSNENYKGAETIIENIVNKKSLTKAEYAMCTYLLGIINMHYKKYDEGAEYFSRAAITDIETATKDQGAIQNLAIYNYYNGKIDLAYKYAKSALEDAVFCNVKFRTLMMTEFYSIINAAYQEKEEKTKFQLQIYLLSISLLSLFLIVSIFYVYRQMKRLSKVKEALSESGIELQKLNEELQGANEQLRVFNSQLDESNSIKEVYIAQFFDICSSYITKMEDYRKKLHKKAVNKQFEDLSTILKSSDITDNELQELYRKFDTIFIKLYPDFISDFNDLLIEEEKIIVKEGEVLNTELRIFALERLGITDSEKIASFFRLSMSTIYNYRTKIRNKSVYSKEEFTKRLEKIGTKK